MEICVLFLLFLIYSILGWIVEVLGKLIEKGKFINRGFLIGPYCPIYGFACIIMTVLWNKYLDDPFILFILIILTASITEYITSYIFEKIFKTRWWDYTKYKFNINGRICLETMIPFGIAGMIVMYGTNPFFLNLLYNIPTNIIYILSITLFIMFITDNIITFKIMFNIKNLTKDVKQKRIDSTERITKLVRKRIEQNNKKLQKRIINAFPHLVILNNKIKEKQKQKN